MSSLREPSLGPIVGHTTNTSARIWIRGDGSSDEGPDAHPHHRTIGVIAVIKQGKQDVQPGNAHYFRLRREFDRTGTFTVGDETGLGESEPDPPLFPDTEYEVRVGTLVLDDPTPDEESVSNPDLPKRLPPAEAWLSDLRNLNSETSSATFRTFPDANGETTNSMAFILGSCRFPGILWQRKHSDAIFAAIRRETQERNCGRDPASFVLMVGDQIYADTLHRHIPLGRADTFKEFQERYMTAFGSRNMRKLLRSVPNYMILDDHEIEDNWSQDRIKKECERQLFTVAINAYMSYQWVHGPDCFGKRLYYYFESGGYRFFVLDTRTQRFMDDVPDSLEDNHMLGRPGLARQEPNQLDMLLLWLENAQKEMDDAPKFIVSSSVFAPNPISAREGRKHSKKQKVKWKEASDSWPAFPATRRAILKKIIEKRIQNVVFLSGDIHCSNVAEIRLSGSAESNGLKMFSITSSAFYWPLPFADGEPSNFVHNSKAPGQEDEFDIDGVNKMNYRAWNFTQENNFCRIDVNRKTSQIIVRPYDANGDLVQSGGWFEIDRKKIVSRLKLAKW